MLITVFLGILAAVAAIVAWCLILNNVIYPSASKEQTAAEEPVSPATETESEPVADERPRRAA